MHSKPTLGLRIAAYAGLAFLHLPLLFIALYAFNNADSSYSFPIEGLTLRWFARALERTDIHEAIVPLDVGGSHGHPHRHGAGDPDGRSA